MTETGRRIKSLLESECRPSISQRSECLSDWYKMAQTVYLQTQILDKDVDAYERTLESFRYRITQEHRERQANVLRLLERLPGRPSTPPDKPSTPPDDENTRKWKSICDMQEQISLIVYQNDHFIHQFEQLATATTRQQQQQQQGPYDDEDFE